MTKACRPHQFRPQMICKECGKTLKEVADAQVKAAKRKAARKKAKAK